MDKNLVIYGAGWEGEKFFYKLVSRHEEKKVLYVADPKAEGTFHGIPIRNELE